VTWTGRKEGEGTLITSSHKKREGGEEERNTIQIIQGLLVFPREKPSYSSSCGEEKSSPNPLSRLFFPLRKEGGVFPLPLSIFPSLPKDARKGKKKKKGTTKLELALILCYTSGLSGFRRFAHRSQLEEGGGEGEERKRECARSLYTHPNAKSDL